MKAGPTLVDYMGGIHLYGAVMTALFQRERTGSGQLVEVAMQEAVYSTLASSFEYHVRTGKLPPRTGNRQAGLASAPYNVFATTDGHVAIHVVTEGHWQKLLTAMGREDLKDDPRFTTMTARARNMEATEAVVTAWTSKLAKSRGVRRNAPPPHPLRSGAHRTRGDERSAHARPRHAGADHPSRARRDRRPHDAAAAARRRQGRQRSRARRSASTTTRSMAAGLA